MTNPLEIESERARNLWPFPVGKIVNRSSQQDMASLWSVDVIIDLVVGWDLQGFWRTSSVRVAPAREFRNSSLGGSDKSMLRLITCTNRSQQTQWRQFGIKLA